MSIRVVKNLKQANSARETQVDRTSSELKALLRDLFRMRHEGVAYSKLAHAQGRVDGYMQMMSDMGLLSEIELLALVAEVRRGSDGPAVRKLDYVLTETPPAVEPTQAIA